jgi:hypothetical protein
MDEPGSRKRMRWLIGTHAVLAMAPLLGTSFRTDMRMLPLIWTLISLPFGGLMSLSVWVGMGRTRLLWRIAIGLTVSFYLAIWPYFNESASSSESMRTDQWIIRYLEAVAPFSILLFLFSGVFMLIGLRFKLAHVGRDAMPPHRQGFQFSMLQIMVVMSIVALVLSLVRATRESHGGVNSTWDWLVVNAFVFVMFIVNTACAAFAALSPGNVKWNVGMVLVVSIVLGIATAIAMRNDDMPWLFAGSMLIAFVPTVTALISLLVVRSCGWRLIGRIA